MSKTENYRVVYYIDPSGREPVKEYIDSLSKKEQVKIFALIEYLKEQKGYLDEPYSKHIKGKIRELRVGFARNRHRIFYFTFFGKKIILLHAFLKRTEKTPQKEINKAIISYKNFIKYKNKYE